MDHMNAITKISKADAAKCLGHEPRFGDVVWFPPVDGRWEPAFESNAKPRCKECGNIPEALMEIGRRVTDWIWRECNTCDDIVCEDCSDESDEGIVTCITCLSGEVMVENKRKEVA